MPSFTPARQGHGELLERPGQPRPAAGRARVLHDGADAPAAAARLAEGEEALALADHSPALALRTGDRRGPGRRPAAPAGRALHGLGNADLRGDPLERVVERQLDRDAHIFATLRPRLSAAAVAASSTEALPAAERRRRRGCRTGRPSRRPRPGRPGSHGTRRRPAVPARRTKARRRTACASRRRRAPRRRSRPL